MAPRISGILNNCGLHIAVPSVIEYFGTLSQSKAPANLPFYQNYLKLKEDFCHYYGLPNDSSFKDIYTFLSNKSFIGQELILGPVLREFLDNQYTQTLEEFEFSTINQLPDADNGDNPEIQPGRFPEIELRTLIPYLLNPLGIKIDSFYVEENDHYHRLELPTQQNIQEIANINIYNKDNHYELDQFPIQQSALIKDKFASFETQLRDAADPTDVSQLVNLPENTSETRTRSWDEINNSVTKVLDHMKEEVKSDFQSEILSPKQNNKKSQSESMAQYINEYREHLRTHKREIETYAAKGEAFYQKKGEILHEALRNNPETYQPLLDAIKQYPIEYASIKDMLERVHTHPDNPQLKTILRETVKYALVANDKQLAELLQHQEYQSYMHHKPGK